ncbi:MAG: phenylalanine--tRNA ligase beta subunit-related protein [Thermoanaerobaculia bacterium]
MTTMFPPMCEHRLDGWALLWADLEPTSVDDAALSALCSSVAGEARGRYSLESLSSDPTVNGIRKLFRAAGTDPTRYRPSNEALLRRLLKGEEMPRISPIVDLNNCLSAALAVPVCVMDVRHLAPPFHFRAGREGETYESLRGPFGLEGKPLLVDALGPADTPITGGIRVKVRDDSPRVWLVAYMPQITGVEERAGATLESLLSHAPVATLHSWGITT